MNVIARLEYELAFYDSAVHRFNHYTTRTPPWWFGLVWFGLVWWHINHCRLFKAKSSLYIYHHHYHIVPPAQISLALSHHFSLSFIAFGRSSGLHPVSSHSCCMYARVGRPAFYRSYAGVHRNTSLLSSSLHLQQCPACLVRLTWIDVVMGGRWPYSWCLVGCCRQDLFNISRSITITKHILLITLLKWTWAIFCVPLIGSKYFHIIQIILFTINHLIAHS